jgi:tetratricopeptide (TPR) repeat protein
MPLSSRRSSGDKGHDLRRPDEFNSPRPARSKKKGLGEALGNAPSRVAQGLLLLLLVVAPWCYGGVDAWFQSVAAGVMAVCIACWIGTFLTQRSSNELLPVLVVPLLVALAIPWLQVVKWPATSVAAVSPAMAALDERLTPRQPIAVELPLSEIARSLGGDGHEEPAKRTLSVYPAATRSRACLLAMAIAAFVLGARFFRRQKALMVLLCVAAANGVAVAFLGWVQKLSGKLILIGEIAGSSNPFGPFINKNNGAGFLNLSLACAIGLLAYLFSDAGTQHAFVDALDQDAQRKTPEPQRRALKSWRESIGSLNAAHLAVILAVGCLTAAVFSTLSRGGMIALCGAAAVTWLATRLTGSRMRLGAVAVAIVAAFGFVAWVGVGGQVESRVGEIFDVEHNLSGSRGHLLSLGAKLAARHWTVGTGLGTFRYINGPDAQVPPNSFFEYVENQYIETAVEAGIGGFFLLLVVLAMQAYTLWQLSKLSIASAAWSAAGFFAVSSQAIQAMVDFGLYLPSNFLLFGLLCGALSGRAGMLADEKPAIAPRGLSLGGGRLWSPVIAVVLLVVVLLGWREQTAAATIAEQRAQTRWSGNVSSFQPDDLLRHIELLSGGLRGRPDDAAGQMRLADLYILLFRTRAMDELAAADVALEQRWNLTDPSALHRRAAQMALENDEAALSELRSNPMVVEYLGPAWKRLAVARQSCPTMDDVHLRLAELQFLVGDPLNDRTELERAAFLAPRTPPALMRIAVMHLDDGRIDEACEVFRQAWPLLPPYVQDVVVDNVLPRLAFSPILDKIVPNDPQSLIAFAARLAYRPYTDYVNRTLERAEEVLARSHIDEGTHDYLLGRIAVLRGEPTNAIEHYRRAVKSPRALGLWHYELAQLLEAQGLIDEATEEAGRAWQLSPHQAYGDLLARLRLRRPPAAPPSASDGPP